jgi:YD repeat-containing protein
MRRPFVFALLCSVAALCAVRAASAGPVYDCTGTGTVYDSVANVVVTPRGSAMCLVYDDSTLSLDGHLNAAAPLGSTNLTSTTYDSAGRLVGDTGGFATSTVYDSSGRLATDTNPSGTEQYFYDNQNRLASESGPASITQTIYDAFGRLASLTDSQGTISFTYDAQGRLIEADNGALMTAFTYDALGRLLTETMTNPVDYNELHVRRAWPT